METVVIEIQTQFRDKAAPEVKEWTDVVKKVGKTVTETEKSTKSAAGGVDRFTESMLKTQRQAEKLTRDTSDLATKMRGIAGMAITIPVKVLDYATKPLRGIYNFATSLRGIVTGVLAGKAWNVAINQPLALADSYRSAFIGFQTLFKDQERAQRMMNDLDDFARKTPFKSAGVIAQSQKMLAMGWNPNDIVKDMRRIGDAAAATGKGDEGLNRITMALSLIKRIWLRVNRGNTVNPKL